MTDLDVESLKASLVRREAKVAQVPPSILPMDRIEEMAGAADEIEECYRVLDKGGSNLVAEVLRGQGSEPKFRINWECRSKIRPSERLQRKANPTSRLIGYHHHELRGYLGNVD